MFVSVCKFHETEPDVMCFEMLNMSPSRRGDTGLGEVNGEK